MTYYRVRKEYDNFPKNPKTRDCDILIYAGAFERVEVPKSQTYWFFGARFAKGGIRK